MFISNYRKSQTALLSTKIYAAQIFHHLAILKSPVLTELNKIKLRNVKTDARDQIN